MMGVLTDAVQKLNFAKLSMRERILAIVTAMAVLWAYLGFFLIPMTQDVKSMRTQKVALKAEIDLGVSRLPILQKQLLDLRRAARDKEAREEFSGKAADILPGGSRLSVILEELTRLARLRRIEFVSVRPDSIEDKGTFLQLTLRIDVSLGLAHSDKTHRFLGL